VTIAESVPEEESTTSVTTSGRLRRVLNPLPSATSTLLGNSSPRFRDLPEGSTIEVSPTSFRIAHQIARLLSVHELSTDPNRPASEEKGVGGCGLIIDYGADRVFEDSFRVSPYRHKTRAETH